MDDRETTLKLFALIGATAEASAESGMATPILYTQIDIAVKMAEELELGEDIITHLKLTQIALGEAVKDTMEMIDTMKEQFVGLRSEIVELAQSLNDNNEEND
jgi:Fe-S-cluster formation regulator IscX/YfhJ